MGMSDILFHYEKVNPTSWAYLSSLLMLALFFKFTRIWSLRNLDLLLLIALAPGLLLTQYGLENVEATRILKLGFMWLHAVGVLLMIRLLVDPAFVRRPLLEPNLNSAGLGFLGGALLFFLMANIVTGKPKLGDVSPGRTAAAIREGQESDELEATFDTTGPGYWLLYLMPRITTQKVIAGGTSRPAPPTESDTAEDLQQNKVLKATARVMAILSQVSIVTGLLVIGARHFENGAAGLAAAAMYLLLPYTALWTGDVRHVLPASLLVGAVALYRRPIAAGVLLGLASGMIYYPVFLLPLWCSFYWRRGVKRFAGGVLLAIAVLVIVAALIDGSFDVFRDHFMQMFGLRVPTINPTMGIWQFWDGWYRLPILALFVALAFSFIAWPEPKNLGHLVSGTAALMLGVQFWHAHDGGLFIAWYLPLLLLTIYRPSLEDRVALSRVAEGWWQVRQRRRAAAG
ncbi:MAG: hypothetical protein KF688_09140 [Pirellulales bacterium]|nr:hypothetical protein [Pirellulales bacterium]